MKTTLLVLLVLLTTVLLTTAAFGQYGTSISSQPAPFQPADHPEHASYAPLAHEQTLVAGGGYTFGHGDRPASDFPQAAEISLGEIARALRKQHESAKKAPGVWEKQGPAGGKFWFRPE
jgi:hypothetical protein